MIKKEKVRLFAAKAAAYLETAVGKRLLMFAVLMVLAAFPLFADSGFDAISDSLNEKVGGILKILGSPWVKGIACIALIIECIALLTAGRQEPGMFKKFIPWIAGTLLLLAAGTITTAFLGDLGSAYGDVTQ
jgi:type IV secretory pathway VirB2 component (pilin)